MQTGTPRALLVTPMSPWEIAYAAQQRTALLHEALSELMPVDVLMLTEGEANAAAAGDRPGLLARLTWRHPPWHPYKYGVHPWVNRWCHSNVDWSRYGVVVSRYLTPITKVRWPRHLRTIVDCDDAWYRYAPATENLAGRAVAAARSWVRYLQARMATGSFDHAFFSAPRDQALFPSRSSSVLPNALRAQPAPPPPAPQEGGTILFVGSMWYPPNREGVQWFLERCWPAIAARCPTLMLRIVGAAPPADRAGWSRAVRTEAPGFVEDLRAEYARALFTIAPIRSGGGSCLKFLESAAYGRACVASRHVFQAFAPDFQDGRSTLVFDDAAAMVRACVALVEGAPRRDEIAREAYRTVTERYTAERFKQAVQTALREVSAHATPSRGWGERARVKGKN